MAVECNGQVVWCIWRSVETGEISISALSVRSGQWSSCVKDNQITILESSLRLGLTSREYFLNLIFAPGVFSLTDIAKVLSVSYCFYDFIENLNASSYVNEEIMEFIFRFTKAFLS